MAQGAAWGQVADRRSTYGPLALDRDVGCWADGLTVRIVATPRMILWQAAGSGLWLIAGSCTAASGRDAGDAVLGGLISGASAGMTQSGRRGAVARSEVSVEKVVKHQVCEGASNAGTCTTHSGGEQHLASLVLSFEPIGHEISMRCRERVGIAPRLAHAPSGGAIPYAT